MKLSTNASWASGKELIFDSAKCVPCSAKCALCSGVRSDLTMLFKPPAQKKRLLKVSLKSVKNWKNCRQMCFRVCLPISPFKNFNSLAFDFLFRSCLSILWLKSKIYWTLEIAKWIFLMRILKIRKTKTHKSNIMSDIFREVEVLKIQFEQLT